MVLTVSFVLSPVIGLFCHRRQRTNVLSAPGRADSTSANLTPASGRQDHTTSPYAATSLVRSLLIAHKSFNSPCDPVARKTLPRPPHPIPRPIAIRPSVGRDGESSRIDLGQVGTEIFFGKSEIRLDTPVNKRPDGQITTRRREQIPLVSRTQCSVLPAMPTGHANARPMTGSASSGHAAPQSRDLYRHEQGGPRISRSRHAGITAKGQRHFRDYPAPANRT
jgi:hypothetical protein